MLVVLYGKTGSGKSTIAKRLDKRFGYSLAISATSRPPRKHEVDGLHYYFKTAEEMQKLFFIDHKLAELIWAIIMDYLYQKYQAQQK